MERAAAEFACQSRLALSSQSRGATGFTAPRAVCPDAMVGAPAKPTPTPPPPAGKPRPNPPSREPGSAPRRSGQPAAIVRATVSLLLVWHISAVVLAPMSVPPSSQLVQDFAQGRLMQWYLD